ncbi:MAG: hypothetical protein HFJ91_10190 [Muribaculaceae bacterium]|nr:hypothetical protein [Muribaculaceae bacterium]
MIFAILASILLVMAVVMSFFTSTYAAAIAFLGLCCAGLLPGEHLSVASYVFWGVAMVIVIALGFMLPPGVARSRKGLPYIAGGALAGMAVGLTFSHAALVAGAFIGAVLGGVAYARTPQGKVLEFPTSRFLNYLCAKGLPAVVTMSIAGTAAIILYVMWPA